MTTQAIFIANLSALLLLAGPAVAGPDRGAGDDRAGPAASRASGQPRVAQAKDKRAKVIQRIRALRAWKLTEALELDEATAAKLFPILNRYDEQFARLMRENNELRKKVREQMKSGAAGDAKLEPLLDQMTAQQRKLWDLQEARFRDVRKVLTPRQAARIFVVLPEIDRRIHQRLRRAGKKGSGPGGKTQPGDLPANPYGE